MWRFSYYLLQIFNIKEKICRKKMKMKKKKKKKKKEKKKKKRVSRPLYFFFVIASY